MSRHQIRSVLGLVLCLSGLAAAPASRPTTQPHDERVLRLVAQLGHEDFRQRDQASAQLESMGDAVVQALNDFRQSDNPEIATRVEALLRRIGERAVRNGGGEGEAALAVHHFVTVHKDRGKGTIEAKNDVPDAVVLERVNETNRYRIVMHRDKTGIAITLAAFVAGDLRTEQYKVPSEAELKEKYPKLHQVHESLLLSLNPKDEMRVWWRQFAPPPEGPARRPRHGNP